MCSFYGWVIFHRMHVTLFLYPFVSRWTSRLLPCSSIVNSAAVNIGVHVSFSILIFSKLICFTQKFWFQFPQGICLVVGLRGHMVVLFLFIFEEAPYHLPQWLYQFTSPPTVQEGSLFSTSSPAFTVSWLFDDGQFWPVWSDISLWFWFAFL